MVSTIILGFLGIIIVLVALLTGVLGKIWLALFAQELNLPFMAKKPDQPKKDQDTA